MATTLDRELTTYRLALPGLLADPGNHGRFALIHEDAVAGLFPSFDAALAAGYERFELAPFLVQEVTDQIRPKYFSRNLPWMPANA